MKLRAPMNPKGISLIKPANKQRRACHVSKSAVKVESRIDFTVSAAGHVCRLVGSPFLPMLQQLTKGFINDDALILKVICDFEAASEVWAANAKEEKRPQSSKPLMSTNVWLIRSSSSCSAA